MYRQNYPNDPGMHNTYAGHRYPARSFCDVIKEALCAAIAGVILLIVGVVALSWNEGRAVTTARSLDEGLKIVTELNNPNYVDETLNGKLIHITGSLHCEQPLYDNQHGVALKVTKLNRVVEMYQWVERTRTEEREDNNGRTETVKSYSYDQKWVSHAVNSGSFAEPFNHRNPGEMPFTPETWKSKYLRVGSFQLPEVLIDSINDDHIFYPTSLPAGVYNVQIHHHYFYYGFNPNYPQVGDVRVYFKYSGICQDMRIGSPAEVSVIAAQRHSQLAEYQTDAGDTLQILSMGRKSAMDMIYSAKVWNMGLTWLIRFGGFLLNFFSFTAFTSIITAVAGRIPILRDVVHTGVMTANLCLATSVTLTVIAISWIIYRPMFAIAIIALALLPILLPRLTSPRTTRSML